MTGLSTSRSKAVSPIFVIYFGICLSAIMIAYMALLLHFPSSNDSIQSGNVVSNVLPSPSIAADDFCDFLLVGGEMQVDEVQSAACSYWTVGSKLFRCRDGTMLLLSRIRDGVCDCCDGGDELRKKCPNHCIQSGSQNLRTSTRV